MAFRHVLTETDVPLFGTWTCQWNGAAEKLFAEPPVGWTVGKHVPTNVLILVLPDPVEKGNLKKKLSVRGIALSGLQHMSIYDAERMKLINFFTKDAESVESVESVEEVDNVDDAIVSALEDQTLQLVSFSKALETALCLGDKPDAIRAMVRCPRGCLTTCGP